MTAGNFIKKQKAFSKYEQNKQMIKKCENHENKTTIKSSIVDFFFGARQAYIRSIYFFFFSFFTAHMLISSLISICTKQGCCKRLTGRENNHNDGLQVKAV